MTIQEEVIAPEFLVATSDVSEVYTTPFDKVFVVHSKLFDDYYVARAYVDDMRVNVASGRVEFKVHWKSGRCRNVRYPFHFYSGGILYALKKNKQRDVDSFGLNHELFALEWDCVVIVHFVDDEPCVFTASRDEWMKDGAAAHVNEELQVFLKVPIYRRLPLALVPADAADWLSDALTLGMTK